MSSVCGHKSHVLCKLLHFHYTSLRTYLFKPDISFGLHSTNHYAIKIANKVAIIHKNRVSAVSEKEFAASKDFHSISKLS